MERQLKFRGKNIHTREWLYGDYHREDKVHYITKPGDYLREYAPIEFIVDEKTVGQFTGMYDKNGKEIYEGDIILCKDKHVYSVEWLCDGFYMKGKLYGGVTSIKSFLPNQREVIGNIHNNLELISDKQ